MLTRNDSRPPAPARVDLYGYSCNLYPAAAVAAVAERGKISVPIGLLPSGRPLMISTASLEWLDDLISVLQRARAAGVVEAGMTPGTAMGTRS